ncbi:MAG: RcnB family protein [Caulobacteraceae bacterium]
MTTRKVDVTRYRKVIQAPRRYRIVRPWIAPRGFTYRRFGLGERVPAALLVASFLLGDFANYGLESPPYGYVWVRDGTDAVLVDRSTGEVIQVQYGLFY